MRILFLTHYYPPEGNAPANRVSELAKVWAARGHSPIVVTCAPNHPGGRVFPPYKNRVFQRETIDGVEVLRLWTYLASNEGFARRILNYLSFLISLVLQVWRLPRADVVVSTSPQFFCGLAGWFVARVQRVPWVLEIRDLWPESIVTVGAMKRGIVIRVIEAMEAWAYRTADAIVSVTRSFTPHFIERGASPERIEVITNGVDLSLFDAPSGADEFRREHGLSAPFIASYVGTHGMAHRLETALEAAALTRDDKRILWLFVGDGAAREQLVARQREMGLSNVAILGQLPRADMPRAWAASNAALVLLKDDPLFRKVIPSKIFEAMAMRRPIVLGVAGEAAEIVAAGGCGIAIRPENAADLATAVRRLADDPGEAARLGEAGRIFVAANYDRSVLADRYLALLEGLVARARATRRMAPTPGVGS